MARLLSPEDRKKVRKDFDDFLKTSEDIIQCEVTDATFAWKMIGKGMKDSFVIRVPADADEASLEVLRGFKSVAPVVVDNKPRTYRI